MLGPGALVQMVCRRGNLDATVMPVEELDFKRLFCLLRSARAKNMMYPKGSFGMYDSFGDTLAAILWRLVLIF